MTVDRLSKFAAISCHERVSQRLFSVKPAWVWSLKGDRVLWSNESGCRYLGAKTFKELSKRKFNRMSPATAEIIRIARKGELNQKEKRSLSFYLGMTPLTVHAHLYLIDINLPDAQSTRAVFIDVRKIADKSQAQINAGDEDGLVKMLSWSNADAALISPAGKVKENSKAFPVNTFSKKELRALSNIAEEADKPIQVVSEGNIFTGLLVEKDDGDKRLLLTAVPRNEDRPENLPFLIDLPSDKDETEMADPTRNQAHSDDDDLSVLNADAPANADHEQAPGDANHETTKDAPLTDVRFLIELAADASIAEISEPFAHAVGAPRDGFTNQSLFELADDLLIDPQGALPTHFDQEAIWSGRFNWPLAGTGTIGDRSDPPTRAPVDLTVMPVFDAARTFQGFRGFGTLRLKDANKSGDYEHEAVQKCLRRTAEQTPAPEKPSSKEKSTDASESVHEDDLDKSFEALDAEDTQTQTDMDLEFESDEGISDRQPDKDGTNDIGDLETPDDASTNIIPLHGKPKPVAADETSVEDNALTKPERRAFEQIARALNARIEGEKASSSKETEGVELSKIAVNDASASPKAEEPRPEEDDVSDPTSKDDGAPTKTPTTEIPEDLVSIESLGAETHRRVGEDESAPPTEDTETDIATAHAAGDADDELIDASDERQTDEDDLKQSNPHSSKDSISEDIDGAAASVIEGIGRPHRAVRSALRSVANVTKQTERPVSENQVRGLYEDGLRDITKGVLNRLPLGLIVSRNRQTLFANASLLDFLGYEDLAAFEEAGGLKTLFAPDPSIEAGVFQNRDVLKSLVLNADHEAGDAQEPQTAYLKTASGDTKLVELRLQSGEWRGETALLMTLAGLSQTNHLPLSEDETVSRLVGQSTDVMDIASDGILIVNAKAHLLHANASAEALFGHDRRTMRDMPLADLFAEESHKPIHDYIDGLTSNGVASVLNDGREVIGREAGGGLIPLFMTMGRIDNEAPADQAIYCAVLRDITQWKAAEEELIKSRRMAENANAQKSEFLAKISHEIRTPLNAIIGFSEVMMSEHFGPMENKQYLEYARDIHTSGTHLVSLVNDLLDLSKIEAGKLDLSFSAVALNPIIQECVAIMQPDANRQRIILRTSLLDELPPVVADARSIRQIALNLLSNAVKFTDAGGQVIISTMLEDNGEVTLRVRDTGIGMTDKDLEKAMQPFRQVGAASRGRGAGTGLGLPLTKALTEANKARFSIDSRVDYGTLIQVVFPNERVLAH
ncbi:MAG: ATP-binding protein [Pseudomonadota bacterium]